MTNVGNIQKPFGEWAKSIQSRLDYEYQASKSILTHGSVLGAVREGVVRDILAKFLPSAIEIGTGQVVDVTGKLSDQVDIIIAKDNTPVFRFEGGMSAFLYETVLATVEVKSMMYRDKLKEALENSKSVKNLTYMMHIKAKGVRIFDEAIRWIDDMGGLDELEKRILSPSLINSVGCPDDIWQILHFVRYWLHWEKGNLANHHIYQKLADSFDTTDFDFFTHLLQHLLKQDDIISLMVRDYMKAKEVKQIFFENLYKYVLYELLPPDTFVFAYGGYKNLRSMVDEVHSWYTSNRGSISWYTMPRMIMNHKLFMYRHYNEYHCNEFDYPILFFMNAICNMIAKQITFPTSIGASSIVRYFDIGKILGQEHPKYHSSYLVWSIPIDNKNSGQITAMNAPSQIVRQDGRQIPIHSKRTNRNKRKGKQR